MAQLGQGTALSRFIGKNRKLLNKHKTAKNPFSSLKAPDGNYYCQVKRVGMTERKDKDDPNNKIPIFQIQTVIVCNENGETDALYVGEQPRIENQFKEYGDFTLDDITEQMYFNLQGLDCDTSLLIMDEKERESEDQYTLETAIAYAQFMSEYVLVNISTSNKGYRNCRLRGIIEYETVVSVSGLTDLPPPRTPDEFAQWWQDGGEPEAIPEEEQYEEGTEAEAGDEGAEAYEEEGAEAEAGDEAGEEYEEYEEEAPAAAPARSPARRAPAAAAPAATAPRKSAPAKGARPAAAAAPPRKGPPNARPAAPAPAPAKKAVAKKAAPAGRPAQVGAPPRKGPPRR